MANGGVSLFLSLKPKPQRTSLTHPLAIAECVSGFGGMVGLSLCPGKKQPASMTGAWNRDLDLDIAAIRAWGAGQVISLVEDQEMVELCVPHLEQAVIAAGMIWRHHPLPDGTAPSTGWLDRWNADRQAIHAALTCGEKIFVHCKGGLGRAGTIAAMLLIDGGANAEGAMREVRLQRGAEAIETPEQEAFLVGWAGRGRCMGPGRP